MQIARRCGAVTIAALAMAAPAASAADKPTPCNGKLLVTDPAGDTKVGFVGLVESPMAAGPNVDFTGLFINNANGKVTVNYTIADLSTTVPTDATAIGYRMNYDVGDTRNYLQVNVDSAGTVTYSYGHIDTAGTVKDGDTTGAFFEGKDGVITIDVPASHGGKPGTKLAGVTVFSAYVRGRVNTQTDEMPDEGGEASYNGAACPAGSTAPPPSGPAPAPGDGSGGSGGGSGGSGGGGSSQPPAAPGPSSTATAPLKVKAAPSKLKVRKTKKAKKLTFKLTSQEDLTNLSAALKKGDKVLGSGKLAKLARTGKLVVTMKSKLKKKGSYTLVLTGRRADGSTGTVLLKIRVA